MAFNEERYRKAKLRIASRKWRQKYPERVNKINRNYCKARPEWKKESDRRYRETHREQINEYGRQWMTFNRQKNPTARLAHCIRTGTNIALRGISKSAPTFKLVGCSPEELWIHLESKFVPGMSRKNYGPVWHVDHMRPISSFDLADPEQQKQCFHYTNLQPLFALDNLKKGSKWLS